MVQNVSTDTEHDNVSEYPVMQESHEYLIEEKVSVKRGKIKEFTTYEVPDYELVLLERGSDASLWLNFGVALLSIFFSLLAALLTLDTESKQTVFIVWSCWIHLSCVLVEKQKFPERYYKKDTQKNFVV